jgi:hypothetical protein
MKPLGRLETISDSPSHEALQFVEPIDDDGEHCISIFALYVNIEVVPNNTVRRGIFGHNI